MYVFTLIWGNQNAVSYTYLLRYIKQLLKRTLSAKIETTDTNLKGVEARLNPLGHKSERKSKDERQMPPLNKSVIYCDLSKPLSEFQNSLLENSAGLDRISDIANCDSISLNEMDVQVSSPDGMPVEDNCLFWANFGN